MDFLNLIYVVKRWPRISWPVSRNWTGERIRNSASKWGNHYLLQHINCYDRALFTNHWQSWLSECWCPKDTAVSSMSTSSKKESLLPWRIPIWPSTLKLMCPTYMSWRLSWYLFFSNIYLSSELTIISVNSPWSLAAMSLNNSPGVITTGTLPMKVSSTWGTTSTCPQR